KPTLVFAAHVSPNHAGGISPQYECVHVIPRTPTFAPSWINPLGASRFKSSFDPSCRQTRFLSLGIRDPSAAVRAAAHSVRYAELSPPGSLRVQAEGSCQRPPRYIQPWRHGARVRRPWI